MDKRMKRNRELNKCSKNRSMIDKYSGKERKYANKGTGQDFFFLFFCNLILGEKEKCKYYKVGPISQLALGHVR